MPECGGTTVALTESSRPRRAASAGPAPADHEDGVTRIMTALDGHELQRIDHAGMGDFDNGECSILDAHAETIAKVRMAAAAFSLSSCMEPPAKLFGSKMPSVRSASVIVGCVPPRP